MSALSPWRARLSPWSEVDELEDRVNRMLRTFPVTGSTEPSQWLPAIDLKESEAEYTLTAEVPGIPAKDIEMEVEGGVLTLRGEKRSEREETKGKNGRWHVVERAYGSFQRSLTLPVGVDAAEIKADCADGILTIHLPKREESTARKIAIGGKEKAAR